ncbi:hypothetical protein LNI91_11705 [Tenacibaculum dicentrarchi]|nr:hypothetical protein [Tenacibaculum dicentrarchi]
MFNINIFGRTATFVFDNNATPQFLEASNWKIDYTFEDTNTNNKLIEFIITDELGIKYVFDIVEVTDTFKKYIDGVLVFENPRSYNSVWKISKVIFPNSNDEILFEYQNNTIEFQNRIPKFKYYDLDSSSEVVENADKYLVENKTIIHTKKIKKIITNTEIVQFNLDFHDRLDLKGGRKLDNINIIKLLGNSTLKRFTFNYDQVNTNNYCKQARDLSFSTCPIFECYDHYNNVYEQCTATPNFGNTYDTWRLFLTSVTESESGVNDDCYCEHIKNKCLAKCSNGFIECLIECQYKYQNCKSKEIISNSPNCNNVTLKEKPSYKFIYNSTLLPPRLSTHQDFWGYYNANGSKSLIPRLYIYPSYSNLLHKYSYIKDNNYSGQSYFLSGADRSANLSFTKAGILEQVIYPTGGSSKYEYESNDFYDPHYKKNIKGGGVRVKKIILNDARNNNLIKEYTYKENNNIDKSSGVLVNIPSYTKPIAALAMHYSNRFEYKTHLQKVKEGWSEFQLLSRFIERFSDSYSPLSNLDGLQVGYTCVNEAINGIKTKYEYYKPKNYLDNATYVNESKINTLFNDNGFEDVFYERMDPGKSSSIGVTVSRQSYASANYIYFSVQPGPDVKLTYLYGLTQTEGYNIFPYPPMSDNDFHHNSKLFRKTEFDISMNKVRETKYDYTKLNKDFAKIYGLVYSGQKVIGRDNYGASDGNSNFVTSWSKYQYNAGVKSEVKKITEKTYNVNGNFEVVKEFVFNPNQLLISEEILKNSKKRTIRTKKYYPEDVINSSSLGHDLLTSAELSIINTLKKQNRLTIPLQTELITKDKNENILSQKTNRIIFKDWGNSVLLPIKEQGSKGSNLLEDRVVYHSYDNKGNPTEVSKKDGTKIYYVWGYEQTQPIAKITGYSTITEAQKTVISNAAIASNADKDEATENDLRAKLELLRKSFDTETVQISTYTYNPLIGVTSITDPRGQTIYYEYDTFNRLEFIKDKDKNILKENKYNYKN